MKFYQIHPCNSIGKRYIVQLLGTLLATMESPAGVVSENGSIKTSGRTSIILDTRGFTNYNVPPRSIKE